VSQWRRSSFQHIYKALSLYEIILDFITEDRKVKSLFISMIIGLLIIPAFVTVTSASEEHENFLKSLPVKGMVTMIDLGRKT
jgi:hypothetical protein